jgi:hypothetical protein
MCCTNFEYSKVSLEAVNKRPSGIGYTFSSQTLQCEVKIWFIDKNKQKSEITNNDKFEKRN